MPASLRFRRHRHLAAAAARQRVGDEAVGLHLLDEALEKSEPGRLVLGVAIAWRMSWKLPVMTRNSGCSPA